MTIRLVPAELLDPVVAYFRPQRVILFGSTARGAAGPDSDIDLLVIVDDDASGEKLTLKARSEARRSYPEASDIFPMAAATFERNRTIVGTLAVEGAATRIHMMEADLEAEFERAGAETGAN